MTPSTTSSAYIPFELSCQLHDGRPRPAKARGFGRREFERLDVYGFLSLKEKRPVEIAGLPTLSVALWLECDFDISAYVERPRKVQVADRTVELDFWVRHRSGKEEFLLMVSEAESVIQPGGKRSAREAASLAMAASSASINLRCITEFDVRVDGQRIMVRNRLLAFAQVAQTLENGLATRRRVLDYFERIGRARIDQAEEALSPLPTSDIDAIICELVCLGALTFDITQGLTRHSVINRRTYA